MRVAIAGAGAFGTALAVALERKGVPLTLWARDPAVALRIKAIRENHAKLPGVILPEGIEVTADASALYDAEAVLLSVPAQQLHAFLESHRGGLEGKALVSCAKGIDLRTLTGPSGVIAATVPKSAAAVLTGPSFAADIARGLPTALTLACRDDAVGARLQDALSTANLRLYRTTDTIGAELGGALKNVMAIACGAAIGAGLGDSARAALLTRGFAEMQRLAAHLGADPDTLTGLSGLGDLALTCTSDLSRNYRYGLALGRKTGFDPATTVEGAATARAVAGLSRARGIDMPISTVVSALVDGSMTIETAMQRLLSRPLKEE